MAKRLPDSVAALTLMFNLAQSVLTFLETLLRLLDQEIRGIGSAALERRPTRSFWEKISEIKLVHEKLSSRLAAGGPAYSVLLPYLDFRQARRPLWFIASARKDLEQRIGSGESSKSVQILYLVVLVCELFDNRGCVKSAVENVRRRQCEILDKLGEASSLAIDPHRKLLLVERPGSASAAEEVRPKETGVDRDPAGEEDIEATGDQDRTDQGEGDADDEREEYELTCRQYDILETMLREKITARRCRQTQAHIVRRINRTHKPATYKRDFAGLVQLGWLQSQSGPAGGVWLSHNHRAAIEQALVRLN
jgi:hypothetical protein